jgi:TRAP-type C4-dicarboxylate transport system permease small subunit
MIIANTSSPPELAKPSLLDHLATLALIIAGVALIGMAAIEGWQVFARYVLNDSPSWTEPVALLFMSTTMMLGAAVGVRREAHFGFFIAVEAAPPTVKTWLYRFIRGIVAGIGLLMAWLGAELTIDSWSFPMAGVALPQGIVFLPISIGGALIAVFALERMFGKPSSSQEQ